MYGQRIRKQQSRGLTPESTFLKQHVKGVGRPGRMTACLPGMDRLDTLVTVSLSLGQGLSAVPKQGKERDGGLTL